jgi:hypothetical protein
MSRGLCAYAITREHELDPAGPHGVMLVTHDGLALLVAEVELEAFAGLETTRARVARPSSEEDPLIMLARRHDVVVRAVFEHHPVLPLQFGTTLRDEESARQLLADHHAEAQAWLTRVDGHREWSVRARLPHPGEPAELAPDGLTLAARRDRLAAAAKKRRDGGAAATTLHEALSRHATEAVHRQRKSAAPLLDAAYLVRTAREPAFHLEAKGHEELEVEVTGPWPPYSFVRLELPTVAHA